MDSRRWFGNSLSALKGQVGSAGVTNRRVRMAILSNDDPSLELAWLLTFMKPNSEVVAEQVSMVSAAS